MANKGSCYTEGVAETSLTICRLFDYLLTIPVNCNALKTLHVWENVLVWSKYNIHSQNTKATMYMYMYMFKSLTVNLIICGCH